MKLFRLAVFVMSFLILLLPVCHADSLYAVSSVNIKPSKGFDKRIVYTFPVPVYLQPKIRQIDLDPSVSIVSKTAECSAEDTSQIYMIAEDREWPYIVVKSSPAIADRNKSVKVECTLYLTLRKDNIPLEEPELLNFTASIPVYNNPLGSVGENAQAQIDGMNDRIWDLQQRTNRWTDVNDVFATIVGVAQATAQADAELQYVSAALWAIASVLYQLRSTPYIGKGLEAASGLLWKGIGCGVINNVGHKTILRYIWNPGIVGGEVFQADWDVAAGRLLATLIKTVSVLYSCQLCDYSSSVYSGTKKAVYGDMNLDIGDNRGKPTAIETFTVYDWDPYRSIHVAASCMCVPGIVYNMRKEVQVNCIYRNCIEQNAELGLPFDNCMQTYKEQNCLYVDGAAWRVSGGTAIAPLLSQTLTMMFEQLPLMIASKLWSNICDPDCGLLREDEDSEDSGGEKTTTQTEDCGFGVDTSSSGASAYPDTCAYDPLDDWAVPLCGVWAGTLMLQETDYFGNNKYPWEKYYAELEGENYCD